jgi:hypothetical protein
MNGVSAIPNNVCNHCGSSQNISAPRSSLLPSCSVIFWFAGKAAHPGQSFFGIAAQVFASAISIGSGSGCTKPSSLNL